MAKADLMEKLFKNYLGYILVKILLISHILLVWKTKFVKLHFVETKSYQYFIIRDNFAQKITLSQELSTLF